PLRRADRVLGPTGHRPSSRRAGPSPRRVRARGATRHIGDILLCAGPLSNPAPRVAQWSSRPGAGPVCRRSASGGPLDSGLGSALASGAPIATARDWLGLASSMRESRAAAAPRSAGCPIAERQASRCDVTDGARKHGGPQMAEHEHPGSTHESDSAGDARTDAVTIRQGGVRSISAREVTIRQGGAVRVAADEVGITQGGVVLATTKALRVTAGGVVGAVTRTAELDQSWSRMIIARDSVHLTQAASGVVAARAAHVRDS